MTSALIVMAFSFALVLVGGYVVKKVWKAAVILAVMGVVASYFGILKVGFLGENATTLGSFGVAFVLSLLPLGIGFFIGLALGFIFL